MFVLSRPIMLQLATIRAVISAGVTGAANQRRVPAEQAGSAGFNDPVKQLTADLDAHQSAEAAARRVS